MKATVYIRYAILLVFLALGACKKVGNEFNNNPVIIFSIKDDQGNIVAGAKVNVYTNDVDYANAVLTKNYAVNSVGSATSDNNGKASVSVNPGKEYYILITYFDNIRFLNVSNITTGGYFDGTHLITGQTLYLDVVITPDDGDILFYTTNTNKLPITISISALASGNASLYTLSGIYSLGGSPKPQGVNTVSIYQTPGTYRYYAKSQDGCVWSDTISIDKGIIKLINLTKCESGNIYFYTTAVNDTLLPLSVKLNNADSIGNVTVSRLVMTCADDKTGSLNATLYKGLYNYFIQSNSGRCVWTGTISLATDDCVVVPIDLCE